MTDNEKVSALVSSLVQTLNASSLPIAVKELALENLRLRIKMAELENTGGGTQDA